MTHNTTEILVGGAVLAAAIGFAVYAGQATGLSKSTAGYELTASFRSLEGVAVGTDLRLAGVKIGTITGVDLNPETYRADTRFTVANGILIPDDSAIAVASEGLLGGNYVEIVPGGSPFHFDPGDEITDTQGAVSLISLLLKFVTSSSSDDGGDG